MHLIFHTNVDWFALQHFGHFLARQAATGNRVVLVAGDTGVLATTREMGAEAVASQAARNFVGLSSAWAEVRALRRATLESSEPVVLSVGVRSILVAGVAIVGTPAKWVPLFTGFGSSLEHNSRRSRVLWGALRLILRRAQVAVVQNDSAATRVASLEPATPVAKLDTAGVDLSRFPEIDAQHGVGRILMACRMLEDKGVREYLWAARELRKSGLQFSLAGPIDDSDGNPYAIEESELKEECRRSGVEYLGVVDLAEALKDTWLFVHPSWHEGSPLAVAESVASGIPPVLSDIAGHRSIVGNSQPAALLFPPRQEDALRAALERIAEDPRLYSMLRSRCLARRPHLGIDAAVENLSRIIADL